MTHTLLSNSILEFSQGEQYATCEPLAFRLTGHVAYNEASFMIASEDMPLILSTIRTNLARSCKFIVKTVEIVNIHPPYNTQRLNLWGKPRFQFLLAMIVYRTDTIGYVDREDEIGELREKLTSELLSPDLQLTYDRSEANKFIKTLIHPAIDNTFFRVYPPRGSLIKIFKGSLLKINDKICYLTDTLIIVNINNFMINPMCAIVNTSDFKRGDIVDNILDGCYYVTSAISEVIDGKHKRMRANSVKSIKLLECEIYIESHTQALIVGENVKIEPRPAGFVTYMYDLAA